MSGAYILQDNINESGGDLALKVNTKDLFNIYDKYQYRVLNIINYSGKKTQLFQILRELYNPSPNIYKTSNEIEYSYNDTYYEFNIQNIRTKNYISFIKFN